MHLTHWLLRSRCRPAPARRARPRFRPSFECLEDRCLLNVDTVTSLNDSVIPTLGELRTTINNAAPGDTIVFQTGLTGTINLNVGLGSLAISKNLTINGPGPSVITINGGGPGTLFSDFSISSGVGLAVISNLTLTGGDGGNSGSTGGAVYNGGSLRVVNCTITGSTATFGGGIFSTGPLELLNSTITGNYGGGTGGGVFCSSNLFADTTSIQVNRSDNFGGGLYLSATATATLNNCHVDGNYTGLRGGGGIYNKGSLSLQGGTVDSNFIASQGYGGGILNRGSLSVQGSTISNNSAFGGGTGGFGAGIYSSGPVNLVNGTIQNNSATFGGGGILLTGKVTDTIQNTRFLQNYAGASGGGLELGFHATTYYPASSYPTLQMSGSAFSMNSAATDGGAVYDLSACPMTLTNCSISGNSATSGGGVAIVEGSLSFTQTLQNCIISNNSGADAPGGGILSSGNLQLINSTITGNSCGGSGGGVYNSQGTMTIQSCTISGNTSFNGNGGGVGNSFGTLSIQSSTISGNTAGHVGALFTYYGGGAFNYQGTLTIQSCTISGNTATRGGGVANRNPGTLIVQASTISGNMASEGGGIYTQEQSTASVQNSTIANNTATNFPGGGGVYAGGPVTLLNCTISGNTSTIAGGGGVSENPSFTYLTLGNSLIAGNTAPSAPDVAATLPVISLGNNLIGDGTGASGFLSSDLVGTNNSPINPLLGSLQNNGGPTFTMALLAGSPAIDAGNNALAAGLTTDQRGLNRFVDNIVDIGAYEFQAPATVTTVASSLNASTFGQSVTFTATVAPLAPGSNPFPGGTVTFFNGTTPLGTVTLAGNTASFTISNFQGGTFTITAQYNGFTGPSYSFSASQGALVQVVNPAATSAAVGTVPTVVASTTSQVVILSAQILSSAGPVDIGSVTFSISGGAGPDVTVPVNASGQAIAAFVLNAGTPAGTYIITATFNDPVNFGGSFAVGSLVVVAPPVPPLPPVPPTPQVPPMPSVSAFSPASIVQVLVGSPGLTLSAVMMNSSRGPAFPLDLLLSQLLLRLTLGADGGVQEIPSEVDYEGQRPPSQRANSTGSIVGIVFEDTNGDGLWQSGEPPLEGMMVYLDTTSTGEFDDSKPVAVTDNAGRFHFDGLLPGTYFVRVVPHRLYAVTTPSEGLATVTVTSEGSTPIVFGCKPLRRRVAEQTPVPATTIAQHAKPHPVDDWSEDRRVKPRPVEETRSRKPAETRNREESEAPPALPVGEPQVRLPQSDQRER
jgi:hypothetical protein